MSTVVRHEEQAEARLRTYVSGFVASVLLSVVAYVLVTQFDLSRNLTVIVIGGLAVVQFIVQAVCFLHVGRETRPRWKLGVFVFMLAVVLAVVFGSIWIIDNLNARMTTQQMRQYLHDQDGI